MNLAANANIALYASMIVYTLAMLAFAWHLAARVATGRRVTESPNARRCSRAGGSSAPWSGRPRARRGRYAAGPGFEESLQSRQRGNIALMLTYLGTALLVASVVMRGVAVARPPWGNMFEFATAGAAAVGVAY